MNCRHCNTELPEGAQFCPKCGAQVESISDSALQAVQEKDNASVKRCKHCFGEIPDGLNYCPNCGERVHTEGAVGVLKQPRQKGKGKDFLIWFVLLIVFVLAIAGISSFSGGFNAETPEDLEYVTYRYDESEVIYIITFGYKDDIVYEEQEIAIVNIAGWEQEAVDEWIVYYDEYAEMGESIEEFEYNKEVTETQLRFELIYKDLGDMNTMKKFADAGFESFEGYGLISKSGTEENILAAGYYVYEYELG